jgi:uncharacterized membrane protein
MVDFSEVMEGVARVFETLGVSIIAFGGLYALVRPISRRTEGRTYFEEARRRLAHPMLLGLEVLVAADIIFTITIDPSLESVAALGVLVLVRVVLSFSLDVEIDGMFPWRRASTKEGPTPLGPSKG